MCGNLCFFFSENLTSYSGNKGSPNLKKNQVYDEVHEYNSFLRKKKGFSTSRLYCPILNKFISLFFEKVFSYRMCCASFFYHVIQLFCFKTFFHNFWHHKSPRPGHPNRYCNTNFVLLFSLPHQAQAIYYTRAQGAGRDFFF